MFRVIITSIHFPMASRYRLSGINTSVLLVSSRVFSSKTKEIIKHNVPPRKKVNCAVYGCGLSASGSLGIPRLVVNDNAVTSKEVHKPLRINGLNMRDIRKVSSGFGFSLFASKDKLYGSGLNNRFQITSNLPVDGVNQDYYISRKSIMLPGPCKILSISSGRAHSLIATTLGVFAFGDNCHGQCAQDPMYYPEVIGRGDSALPLVDIPSDSAVKSVHCTLDTSFVLTESGEIFAFGLNEDGQCANGKYGIQWRPSKIIGDASFEKIVQIEGSSDTLLAISKSGDMFIWGQCEYGQAGQCNNNIQLNSSRRIPFSLGRVTSAGTTANACIVCTEDGDVFVWGVGLIGLGPRIQRLDRPAQLDRTLFDSNKVSKVYAGNTSMAAVNEQGRLFMWGQNRYGLLGLGHGKDQFFPFQVYLPDDVKEVSLGPDHSIFIIG